MLIVNHYCNDLVCMFECTSSCCVTVSTSGVVGAAIARERYVRALNKKRNGDTTYELVISFYRRLCIMHHLHCPQ